MFFMCRAAKVRASGPTAKIGGVEKKDGEASRIVDDLQAYNTLGYDLTTSSR
jgi:hypothetical protein